MPTQLSPATLRRPRAGLLRTTALQAATLLVFAAPAPAKAQPAPTARPQAGTVVAGAAAIAQTPAQTTVDQSTPRAAIDWRTFDVGSQHTVQFNQPGPTAVILNRVTGPNPSEIAGRIQANGQVVITNQSGIVFHKGAQVDAAGLVASAAGIANHNFMAGRMVFDQAPNPDAAVTNAGTITVKETGLAALVAPRVANSGTINARLGRAVLAGAETHTVDLYGDGLLAIDVTNQVRRTPRGPDGKPVDALVTNTGAVLADGGHITITAAAADGIVQTLVQAGGTLRANAVNNKPGTITIAGVGGALHIEGRVAADGGGTVAIGNRTTPAVTVAQSAHLSANGRRGRSNPEGNAGNAGQITVISNGNTRIDGRITARGARRPAPGPNAPTSNGGNVEVSGRTLGLTGRIDTAAPHGTPGHTLIDPTDVTISDHGGPGTVITPAALQAMTGSVTVQADNTIVASSSVTLANRAQNLTLDAGNLIRIDPGITLTTTGQIALRAGPGGITLQGSIAPGPPGLAFNTTGPVIQGPASVIDAPIIQGTVGSAALTSPLNRIAQVGTSTTTNGALRATAGDISVISAIPLTLQSGYFNAGTIVPNGRTITFTADTIAVNASSVSPAASAPGGAITLQPLTPTRETEVASTPTPGRLSLTPATLALLDTPTLALGAPTGAALTLAADGRAIDFGALGFTTVRLRSAANIGQVGAVGIPNIDAAGANIDLSNAGNTIPAIARLAATGEARLHTGQSLAVNGPVTGPLGIDLSSAGGPTETMTLAADITGGTVRLDASDGNSLATSGTVVQTAGTITGTTLSGQARSATLTGPNRIDLADFDTAGPFSLTGAAAFALTGTLNTRGANATLTSPGAITSAGPSGTLLAGSLSGTAASLNLPNPANAVGALQNFSTTTGGLSLTTGLNNNTPLLVGAASVPNTQTLSLTADQMNFLRANIAAGTLALAPLTPNTPMALVQTPGSQPATTLTLSQPDIANLTVNTLRLGSPTTGPITIGAPNDTITLTTHANTLDLTTPAAVTEAPGAALAVNTLTGNVGTLTLAGPNAVNTLGALTTAGAATLANAGSLRVAGPVNAGGPLTLTAQSATLTLAGPLTAAATTLTAGAGGIAHAAGRLTATTLTLDTTGPATQTGTAAITAGTLGGTVGSLDVFSRANAIATLDGLAAANDARLRTNGPLTLIGANTAANWSLAADSIALDGALAAPTGTVRLEAGAAVTQGPAGTLQAATLAGTAASFQLAANNQVAAIADLFSGNDFLLNDTGPLTLTGPLTAGTTATVTTTGPLTLAGNLTAPTVSLTSTTDSITQTAGTLAAATRLTLATPGPILQSGGGIATPLFTGQAGAAVTLAGTNAITGLGPFTTPAPFTLLDGAAALTLAGPLSAATVRLTAGSLAQAPGAPLTTGVLTGTTTGPANFGAAPNQVAVLDDFTSAGGFTLTNTTGLTLAGTLIDTAAATLATTGALTLGGTIDAPATTLAATTITQPSGSITANTLAVTDTTATLTQAANQVAALAAVNSAGAFTLATGRTLAVTGPVFANGPLRLDARGDIALTATLSAPTLQLNATGSITQPGGTLTTTDLSGQSGAAFTLDRPTNLITTLGPVTATNAISLTDARSLTITGPLTTPNITPPNITLTITGDLAIANAITANRLTLDVTGAVTETPSAAITADTLAGAVGSAVLQQSLRLATLATLASNGLLTLQTQTPLALTGPVTAQGPLSLTTTGPLTLAADLTAPTIALTATGATRPATLGTITQTAGQLTATTQLTLTAADAITQTASTQPPGTQTPGTQPPTITTPLLTGTAGTTATLAAPTNQIATVGPFTSNTGLTLATAQPLTVAGPVSDPTRVALDAAGGITLAGPLASTAVNLTSTGPITQQPTASLQATTLTGSAAGLSLPAPGNAITNLGPFASTADLTLATPSALAITGPVQAGPGRTLTLTPGALTIQPGGALIAPAGTVALAPFTPAPFTLSSVLPPNTTGAIQARTLQVGTPTSGDITVTAPFDLTSTDTLALTSAGAITQSPGATITANRLTATAATVRLDQPNAIATLGDSAAASTFTFANTIPLTIAGTLSAGTALDLTAASLTLGAPTTPATLTSPTLTLTSPGTIQQPNGAIRTQTLSGIAHSASLDGANQIETLAGFTTTGPRGGFALANTGPLTVTAPLTATGQIDLRTTGPLTLQAGLSAPVVNLAADSIDQTAGTNRINTLDLTTTTGATLLGTIDLIRTATVPGTLRLIQPGAALTLLDVQANAIDLTAADIALAGAITTRTLRLTGTSLVQNAGTLTADTLTGTLAGPLLLGPFPNAPNPRTGPHTGTAAITTLSGLSTSGPLLLINDTPLTLTGTNQAVSLTIQAPSLTLDSGILTANSINLEATQPSSTPTGITQRGTTTVRPLSAPTLPLLLRTQATPITLDDLAAPAAALTLALDAGSATGALTAASLSIQGQNGTATLTGTVAGLTGFPAAQASAISRFDPAYTLNGCAIAAPICLAATPPPPPPPAPPPTNPTQPTVLLPATIPPPTDPTRPTVRLVLPSTLRPDIILVESLLRPYLFVADLITLDILRDPTDPDFALPNISDRDY